MRSAFQSDPSPTLANAQVEMLGSEARIRELSVRTPRGRSLNTRGTLEETRIEQYLVRAESSNNLCEHGEINHFKIKLLYLGSASVFI